MKPKDIELAIEYSTLLADNEGGTLYAILRITPERKVIHKFEVISDEGETTEHFALDSALTVLARLSDRGKLD